MKMYTNTDDLHAAAVSWRRSLRRYDEAEPEEAGFAALEAEAAARRYACQLNKRKSKLKSIDAEGGNHARSRPSNCSKC